MQDTDNGFGMPSQCTASGRENRSRRTRSLGSRTVG